MSEFSLQQLKPADARLCLAVEKFCLSSLGLARNSELFLAVSGGADSCAMVLIMAVLASRNGFRLCAVHVNHKLRPEADLDAAFASCFCKSLGIECLICQADVERTARRNRCGLEEAGRTARYAIYHAVSEAAGGAPVLLAHHRMDLAEDIIMRLIRGSGWPALSGMRAREGIFARPLLSQSPERLRSLLLNCRLGWREDSSNQDVSFLRNRVRHQVIPMLARENPSLAKAMLNLRTQGDADEAFWNEYLADLLARQPWSAGRRHVFLPAKLLNATHRAARLRLYILALRKLFNSGGSPISTRAETLFKLDRTFADKNFPSLFQLPGNCSASVDKHGIRFRLDVQS